MSNYVKSITGVLVLLLALVPAVSGQSSSAKVAKGVKANATVDDVEQLLSRYILALGGVELFEHRTRIVRGRVEMSESPNPGTFEIYEKLPGKSMLVVNMPGGQLLGATDGDKHWLQTAWGGTKTSANRGINLLAHASKGKDFKWRSSFSSSSLKGRTTINGREMIVLAATPLVGEPMLYYFDAQTFLLRKTELARRAVAGEENRLRAVYLDSYATVDGVKYPAVFRQVYTQYTLTFRATEIKHDMPINDLLFESPNGK